MPTDVTVITPTLLRTFPFQGPGTVEPGSLAPRSESIWFGSASLVAGSTPLGFIQTITLDKGATYRIVDASCLVLCSSTDTWPLKVRFNSAWGSVNGMISYHPLARTETTHNDIIYGSTTGPGASLVYGFQWFLKGHSPLIQPQENFAPTIAMQASSLDAPTTTQTVYCFVRLLEYDFGQGFDYRLSAPVPVS